MRNLLFLALLFLVVSACDSETRYRVSIPNSEKHAYIDIQLSEGGWKTAHQYISITHGYRTGLFSDDYRRHLAYATVYAPAVFITYDELSTEWRGSKLVIHTNAYRDLTIDTAENASSDQLTTSDFRPSSYR